MIRLVVAAALIVALSSCRAEDAKRSAQSGMESSNAQESPMSETPDPMTSSTEPAAGSQVVTLGAGCFWCIEAVLDQIDGVESVVSGYMGGHVANPTYEQICTKTTGHAEVVQVRFDPETVSFEALLEWFWNLHDPTTLNRQGNDEGPQYRSAIYYHSDEQREASIRSMEKAGARFASPIVTEITAASEFWPAEEEHQEFYRRNRENGYCRAIIAPKLDKLGLEK